jgi:hypothetical protein
VRSDAPTLASEPPGASAASGEHAVPDRLTFSDTTVRVHPNPRRRWWIAAFVIACVLVGGVVYVWNLPEPTVYRPALPDPVVTVTDEASQNPDEAAVGGSGAIETSNEEAEVATSNQETDAALDPESAEGALPRPRMMRRARMVPGTVMETAEQTTAMTDMSGIINQL